MTCTSAYRQVPSNSKDTRLAEHGFRRGPAEQKLLGCLLLLHLLEGVGDDSGFDFLWQNDDAVDVAKDDIARADLNAVNLEGNAKIDHVSAAFLVLRVTPIAEDGKVHLKNSIAVARVAGQHGTGGAAYAAPPV